MKRLWLILPVISLVLAQIPLPKPFAGSQTINHLGYTLSFNETHEQVNRVTYDNESIHITTGRVQTDRLTTIGTQSVLSVSWQEQFVQLPSRKNINQPILLLEPKLPIASVILFPGGTGKSGLKNRMAHCGTAAIFWCVRATYLPTTTCALLYLKYPPIKIW